MTRLEANLKIATLLPRTHIAYCTDFFRECAISHPQQRAGQIFCNYICYDYRDPEPDPLTTKTLAFLFPDNRDPFFEESEVTLKRLKKIIKSQSKHQSLK